MNWNSQFGISLFLTVSTGVLSLSQAWVLGSTSARWLRYLVAWLGSAAILAWSGRQMLALGPADTPGRRQMALIVFLLALGIAALAFWSGAYWGGTRAARAADFFGRMRAVAGPHFAVVFFGSCAALLVIIGIGLSNVH